MWPMIIGAAIGLAKSEMDKKQAQKLQQAEAVKTEFSPWTGMKGETVQMPSSIGGAMQGAAMGAMYQQANQGSAQAPGAAQQTVSVGEPDMSAMNYNQSNMSPYQMLLNQSKGMYS